MANLSLMALGSSAPEIMLNVLGILFDDFFISDMGPSTIVGSAAFNLFIILAVCVMSVGGTGSETKRIEHMKVGSLARPVLCTIPIPAVSWFRPMSGVCLRWMDRTLSLAWRAARCTRSHLSSPFSPMFGSSSSS